MSYRPDWWPEGREMDGGVYPLSVTSICLHLHANNNASSDVLNDKEYDNMVKALEWLSKNWKKGRQNDLLFDMAVLNLVNVTLEECKL